MTEFIASVLLSKSAMLTGGVLSLYALLPKSDQSWAAAYPILDEHLYRLYYRAETVKRCTFMTGATFFCYGLVLFLLGH